MDLKTLLPGTLGAAFVSRCLLAAAFLYVAKLKEGGAAYRWFAWGYAALAAASGLSLAASVLGPLGLGMVVPTASAGWAIFMLAAALVLAGYEVRWRWVLSALAATVVWVALEFTRLDFFWSTLPQSGIACASLLLAGVLIWRRHVVTGHGEFRILGALFVLSAMLAATFPAVRPFPDLMAAGFLVASTLNLLMALTLIALRYRIQALAVQRAWAGGAMAGAAAPPPGMGRALWQWMRPHRFIAAAGGLVLLLGMAVLAGWVLHIPALVRLPAGYGTVQINAALGFALCGAGLVAAALGGRHWAGLCGVLAALVGGATLVEYLRGTSLGADAVPVDPFLVAVWSAAARMSPVTAANFVVAGTGLAFSATKLPARWRFLALTSAGAVVIAVAVLARTGYLSRLGGQGGESVLPGMALLTAIGFLLVGGGTIGLGVAAQDGTARTGKPAGLEPLQPPAAATSLALALPILGVCLLLASIGVFLFSAYRAQQADAEVRHTLDVLIALGDIDKALADKEAGYRGFVITGQERFLEPYHAGLKEFAERYGEAKQLTVDNPEQQRNLEVVSSLNERWDDYSKTLIGLRRGVDGEARAKLLVSRGSSKSLIEGMRAEMERATSLEVRLLSERKSREVAIRAVMTATLLLCLVGGILASVSQFLLTRKLESQRLALVSEMARREEAELRFSRVFDLAPNGLVVSDQEGRILFVNAQALRWFGYQRDELLGQSVDLLVPERVRAVHPQHRAGYIAAPVTRPMGALQDLTARRKDGSEFPVDISLSAIEVSGGLQVISSIMDITDRRRAAEELQRANRALEAANKELEAFAYSVSHDLRAPLRGMTGFSQILIEDFGPQLPPEAQDYLGRIQRAGTRMGQLIDDMLTLSRISRGELHRESVSLSALAADVLDDLRKTEPERKVESTVADGLKVSGDARLLRILLDNILGNAWKFTGRVARPQLEFGTVSTEGGQAFYVRDNGAGFDMAYADKLFGAFQRLHTSDEFPGTGIGLAIAQRIVNRHGGRIWAEGSVGKGATFYFTV